MQPSHGRFYLFRLFHVRSDLLYPAVRTAPINADAVKWQRLTKSIFRRDEIPAPATSYFGSSRLPRMGTPRDALWEVDDVIVYSHHACGFGAVRDTARALWGRPHMGGARPSTTAPPLFGLLILSDCYYRFKSIKITILLVWQNGLKKCKSSDSI